MKFKGSDINFEVGQRFIVRDLSKLPNELFYYSNKMSYYTLSEHLENGQTMTVEVDSSWGWCLVIEIDSYNLFSYSIADIVSSKEWDDSAIELDQSWLVEKLAMTYKDVCDALGEVMINTGTSNKPDILIHDNESFNRLTASKVGSSDYKTDVHQDRVYVYVDMGDYVLVGCYNLAENNPNEGGEKDGCR